MVYYLGILNIYLADIWLKRLWVIINSWILIRLRVFCSSIIAFLIRIYSYCCHEIFLVLIWKLWNINLFFFLNFIKFMFIILFIFFYTIHFFQIYGFLIFILIFFNLRFSLIFTIIIISLILISLYLWNLLLRVIIWLRNLFLDLILALDLDFRNLFLLNWFN
jgi:hypothetical protein